MLTAVFDLFVSAEEEAKELYTGVFTVFPLVVGVVIATGTLVAIEKFCFAPMMNEESSPSSHSEMEMDRLPGYIDDEARQDSELQGSGDDLVEVKETETGESSSKEPSEDDMRK